MIKRLKPKKLHKIPSKIKILYLAQLNNYLVQLNKQIIMTIYKKGINKI